MNRRDFLRKVGAGTAGLAAASPLPASVRATNADATPERPNILMVMADDHTYHDLGCTGNPDVKTPNVDQLASEGMRFARAFNSSPMCAPTRMSLYTGIHPVRNGAYPNHSRVYPDIRSMPQYLGDLGYQVGILGKRHEAPLENFPFEDLGGRHHDSGKGVDLKLSEARTFMEENKSRPWGLVVSSNQPHVPWNRGIEYPYEPDELTLPPYLVDTPETRQALARYYAEITYMDRQVGQVLQHLDETGQTENTIVVFLTEHGSNFPHCKWTCYDTGVRSAAIVRWPGTVAPGQVSDAIIEYVDVLPTLLDAVGGTPTEHDFDGQSFLPVLTGEQDTHQEYAFSLQTSKGIYEGPEAYGIRSVRSRHYRLIWNLNWKQEFQNLVTAGFAPYLSWEQKAERGDPLAWERARWYRKRPQFELYDLRADPYELDNRAEDPAYQSVRARLKEELDAWMKRQGDKGAETERNALQRQAERWMG
ncbi:MAG: sulfatase atsG [Proteobacteria bacterium SW_6_67_9]|nr:MAG: sulfatase atsG [Proteobacteria bacterium SW_6_67_9]